MSIISFSPLSGETRRVSVIENRKRALRSEPSDPYIKRQCGSSRMLDRFIAGVTANEQSNLSAFIESICKLSEEEEQIPNLTLNLNQRDDQPTITESAPSTPEIPDPFLLPSPPKSPGESQTESDKEESNEDVEDEDEVSTNDDEPPKDLNSNLDEI